MQWQLIETAPKKGPFVGGWYHSVYGWLWDSCRWQEDHVHKDKGYFYAIGGGRPTHWVLLPDPPTP